MRDRVKRPAHRSGPDVVRADITRSRRKAFTKPSADDHQIVVDDAGRGQPNVLQLRIASEILTEIDSPGGSKTVDGFAGGRIERVNEIVDRGKNAPVASGRPVHQPAVWSVAANPRVEHPELGACCRVDREGLVRGRVSVQNVAHHERLGLHGAGLTGVVGPRDRQLFHIVAIDEFQSGVAILLGTAAISPRKGRRRRPREGCAGADEAAAQ